MNIGTISYRVSSGLGILAHHFYEGGVVNRFLEIPHRGYSQTGTEHWYRPEDHYYARDSASTSKFLKNLDVLLILENAWGTWNIVQRAKDAGASIVIIPMYEWTLHPLPVEADLYICPSVLDLDYLKTLEPITTTPLVYLTIPSPYHYDIRWRLREKAEVFVHNAGHGGHRFRNGTSILLDSLPYVKSPIKLIIRGQAESAAINQLLKTHPNIHDHRLTIDYRTVFPQDRHTLYREGDVFIFPETYNGLSLPLQEAYSAGMLVMCGNRNPMNTWLPTEPMIPVSTHTTVHTIRDIPNVAVYDPKDIAATIDAWYGKDISSFSIKGREWRECNSWDNLRQTYLDLLALPKRIKSGR